MKEYQQLKDLVHSMEEDITKFTEKGTASAGARARKSLQEIKKDCPGATLCNIRCEEEVERE